MINAVLDTNALASGFARRNPESAVVQSVDAWRAGRYTLIISEVILSELEQTFAGPYFRCHITAEQAAGILTLLRGRAVLTTVTVTVQGVATHPEDDLILATAVSAKADYLVSGDTKLQKLGRYQGATIVSPREFMAALSEDQSG